MNAAELITPWVDYKEVTPDADPTAWTWANGDTSTAHPARGLQVATTGLVKIKMLEGVDAELYCIAGVDYCRQFTHVYNTGTAPSAVKCWR